MYCNLCRLILAEPYCKLASWLKCRQRIAGYALCPCLNGRGRLDIGRRARDCLEMTVCWLFTISNSPRTLLIDQCFDSGSPSYELRLTSSVSRSCSWASNRSLYMWSKQFRSLSLCATYSVQQLPITSCNLLQPSLEPSIHHAFKGDIQLQPKRLS